MWPFSRRKRAKSQPTQEELLKMSIQEKLKGYKQSGSRAQFSGPAPLYGGASAPRDNAFELELIDFEEHVN